MTVTRADEQPVPPASAPSLAEVSPAAAHPRNAAGILFLTKDRRLLLLKRGNGGDFPCHWGLPGGHLEEGETAEDSARRETLEETGLDYKGPLRLLRDDGHFSTFLAEPVDEPFPVTTCSESDGFVWTDMDSVPAPLHPGIRETYRIAAADTELAVAELIRDGILTSPQRYSNVWLFDLRITGTGTAYRTALEEHVYRPPEHYMNDEFLARCNGLSVIMEHPEGNTLNSEEFANRAVGSIMLPYLRPDAGEVWGIAKVYDDAAALMMVEQQLSTSPAVMFQKVSDNATISLEDGKHLLIEGKPALLDHLAICAQGVWDKGGEPTGVNSTTEGLIMTEEERKAAEAAARKDADDKAAEEKAKADAARKDADDKMSALADMVKGVADSVAALAKRVDSMPDQPLKVLDSDEDEKKAAEAKAKADAEEAEKKEAEEKAKADAARADAERPLFAEVQARADTVMSALGERAPAPLTGETLLAFRQRLATKLKAHSADFKDVDLHTISDSTTLRVVEERIYADASSAARNPKVPTGQLREVKTTSAAGHQVSTFYGDNGMWLAPFRGINSNVRIMRENDARR